MEILRGEMELTICSWLKQVMCDRRIGELTAKWIGERIEGKIDRRTGVKIVKKTVEPITSRVNMGMMGERMSA
jgi:hypothetical protein